MAHDLNLVMRQLFSTSGLFKFAAAALVPFMLTGCLSSLPLASNEGDVNRDGIWDSVEWDFYNNESVKKYDIRPARQIAIHYQLKLRHPNYVDTVRYGAPSMFARATTCLNHLYGTEKGATARRELNKAIGEIYFGDEKSRLVSPRMTLRRQQHELVDRHWQTFTMVPVAQNEEACEENYRGSDVFNRY